MSGATPNDLANLHADTPRNRIHTRQGPGGRQLDYITARYVMDTLDDSVGPENWQDRYEDRADGSVRGGIGIRFEDEWVWKWDVGTESDIESDKGAYSDAFKRAGVKWGIGRDLYPESTTQAVRVSPPARPAAPTPRPTLAPPVSGGEPEEPDWVRDQIEPRPEPLVGGECPMHHLAWTLRPGGVSKTTGKPYGAFWACPSQDRPFCKEKPSPKWSAQQEMAS